MDLSFPRNRRDTDISRLIKTTSLRLPAICNIFSGAECQEWRHRREVGELIKKKRKKNKKKLRAWMTSGALRERVPNAAADREKRSDRANYNWRVVGRKCVFWATYICVGEAREENKGDDSGCGRPPAVVAPPSPPSNFLALDPPISVE